MSDAVAVTVTVPDTVAPFVGAVICVVGAVTSVPVPVRLLVCVPALSVTFSVADRAPKLAGVNFTLMVQLEFAASVVPQLLVCEKSPGFVPVNEMAMLVSELELPLVSVTGCGELLVPTP